MPIALSDPHIDTMIQQKNDISYNMYHYVI